MSWFRSWHGGPTDNKWLVIAKRANVKPIHVSGTWWALLDHASQHSERGTVDDFDVETFALFAGMEESHVSRIVTALCEKGLIVDGRVAQWGKRQPKREDETAGARKRRERAKSGGKPPPGGGADIHDNLPKGDGHAMSRNVTLDREEQNREEETEANASGTIVPHPAADFCSAIFEAGPSLLARSGMTDRNARSFLGRLRKELGDPQTLVLLRRCETDSISDPAEYLGRAMENRNVESRRPAQRDGENRTRNAAQRVAERFGITGQGTDGEVGAAAARIDAGGASGLPVALLSSGNGRG